jgi:hypothetical protein
MPLIVGGGYNIPMEVLRSLSDWIAVLESRGTVPGASLGSLLSCIQAFETSLASKFWFAPIRHTTSLICDITPALEQVLTTPLPLCARFI